MRGRMAADQLRQHRDLAAGDLHPGQLGAALESLGDRLHRLRVRLLDRQVVEHRDRLGADADDVVDVHGDAVDADRVEPPGRLGDQQLRADAVGADRDPEVRRHLEHGGEVARQRHDPRRAPGLDRAQDADQRGDAAVGGGGVDPRGGVRVASSAPILPDDHDGQRGPVAPPTPRAAPVARCSRRAARRRHRRRRRRGESPRARGRRRDEPQRPSAPPRRAAPAARPRATAPRRRAGRSRAAGRRRASRRCATRPGSAPAPARRPATARRRAVASGAPRCSGTRSASTIATEPATRPAAIERGVPSRSSIGRSNARPDERRAAAVAAASSPQRGRRRSSSRQRQRGAGVQRDLELLALGARHAEPVEQQPDVRGRGDRQQLGRALQQPERATRISGAHRRRARRRTRAGGARAARSRRARSRRRPRSRRSAGCPSSSPSCRRPRGR